jgi:hypothetical protein
MSIKIAMNTKERQKNHSAPKRPLCYDHYCIWMTGRPGLAEGLTIHELPYRTRNGIRISCSIEIHVLESLWNGSTSLRIVAWLEKIEANRLSSINLKRDICRKVELGVECACSMSGLHTLRCRKLPYPGGARVGSIEALLDAVAFIPNQGESKVNLCHHAGDIETFDISNAATVRSVQIWADPLQATVVVVVIVAFHHWGGEGRREKKERRYNGEEHVVVSVEDGNCLS